MEYLVTSQEMRFCDRNTSERYHIPSAVLMERAALACFQSSRRGRRRFGPPANLWAPGPETGFW